MRHIISKNHKVVANTTVDKLALVVGTIQPLMTLPQIALIYSQHSAAQVSIVTWLAYDVASVVLLTYGIKHRLLPIIIAQIIWLVVQTIMIAAIFIFR